MSNKYIKLENLNYYDGKIKEYISNNIGTGNGVAIYDDYSKLPTDLTEKTIAYCEEDYIDATDVDNPITYNKGFYFYNSLNWELIIKGSNGIEIYDDYSQLPIVPDEGVSMVICRKDYIDISITPNILYKKGMYEFNTDDSTWKYISLSESIDEIEFTNLTEHPTDVEENKVKLYAKDDDLYISRSDGTRNRIGDKGVVVEHLEIQELSNPLTTIPLEYGYFGLSSNVSNYTNGENISFDKIYDGNIAINNGVFTLKAGKTYHIMCDLRVVSSTNTEIKANVVNNMTGDDLIVAGLIPSSTTTNDIGNYINGVITPQLDIDVAVRLDTNVTTIYSPQSKIVVQEIRTNPVVQYGGFETQVLFEGSANTPQQYSLNDLIDNYNYLVVESLSDATTKQVYATSLIDVTKIDTTITGQFINSAYVSNTNNYSIQYHFADKESFTISNISNQGYTNPFITRVVGIHGQLPSLLNGGTF